MKNILVFSLYIQSPDPSAIIPSLHLVTSYKSHNPVLFCFLFFKIIIFLFVNCELTIILHHS